MAINVNPEEDFHVVLNGNVMALPLDRLDDWYQSDIISDETLIWQQGLGEWMRLDLVLAQLEQGVPEIAPAPPLSDDIYFVLVAEGEVKQMSLDLMADSFRLDVIDDETLVWQPGYTEWIPLKLLIGDEPAQHVSVAPSFAPSAPPFTFSIPMDAPKASPWFQRALYAAAGVTFALVAYRNGAGLAVAESLGQTARLAQLESGSRAPGPETPHGLDAWLAQVEETYHLADLSETEPVKATKDEASDANAEQEKSEQGKETSGSDADLKSAKKDSTAEEKAAPETKASESNAKNPNLGAFSAKLNNEPLPKKAASAPIRKARSSGALPSSGNPNDPMNGSL